MKFSLLALVSAASAWSSAAPAKQYLYEGPIYEHVQPSKNLAPGHVRLDVNVNELHEQFGELAAHQQAFNLPPIAQELQGAAQDATYQIAASDGRIMGPALLQLKRLVTFLDPSKKCNSAEFATCLETTHPNWRQNMISLNLY